jgi:hypothetical protein
MKRLTKWEKAARRTFALKLRKTPSRVFRDPVLRKYFLADFFHDAAIVRASFDHSAQTARMVLLTSMNLSAPYSSSWGIRLPKYEEGSQFFAWTCEFNRVSHFSVNAVLTKVELANGKRVEQNWAFHPWRKSRFEFLSGRFLASPLLRRCEHKFKRKMFHLKMDCDTRTVDIVFDRVKVKRGQKAPNHWTQKKAFERYVRSA